jgi:3-deoxy-manno-octulosonate cytidylyltransferase (CMP-KDO synthetase)
MLDRRSDNFPRLVIAHQSAMFKVFIPARYASTRLPGKALLPLGGKPIVQHVYENALDSGAAEVVIATDDERIAQAARGFGARVIATSDTHESGTDRVAEAVSFCGESDDTIVVNVQGDEPELPAVVIQQVAEILEHNHNVDIATVCEPVASERDIDDPNIVKVVRDDRQRALYFSRAPIPYIRDGRTADLSQYRRHVGIYAYRNGYLQSFVAKPVAYLEQWEKLEQLRALAAAAVIAVPDAVAPCGVGVDTQSDYDRLVRKMKL